MRKRPVEVVRVQATASYVFAADNARARAPFDQQVASALAKEFSAADVVVQGGDHAVWMVRQGTCRFSEKRRVECGSLMGSAHELSVSVEGLSDDAKDVLNEVWSKLGELTDADSENLTEYPGELVFATVAIVSVSGGFRSAFPGLEVLQEYARTKMAKTLVQRADALQFRIELPVEFAVRGLNARRSFVIERRFTALTEDRVYFTASPLNSTDHIELLESLCVLGAPPEKT